MIGLAITFIVLAIPVLIGIAQYKKHPKPPNGYSYEQAKQWYFNREWEQDEESTEDAIKDERIAYLDEAIIKYNKLLESLGEQLKTTYDEKERSKLIARQITTLEKLARALEKREKLD